jgi:hypothetical protein
MAVNTLECTIRPGQLAYGFHHLFDTACETREFTEQLERALVVSVPSNTEFAADVATAWAGLRLQRQERVHATDTVTAAEPNAMGTEWPDKDDVAEAILAGHTHATQISYLRFLLCQRYGPKLFYAQRAVDTTVAITDDTRARIHELLTRFAKDCSFPVTGDWMLHARVALMCAAWVTCVTDGNEPAYKVASLIYHEQINKLAKSVTKTPVGTHIKTTRSDGVAVFIATFGLIRELQPATPVAINCDIFFHCGTRIPVPFYMQRCILPGLAERACYGYILGDTLHIYNGRGVNALVADWAYLMHIGGHAGNLTNYIFNPTEMNDSNPYAKYDAAKMEELQHANSRHAKRPRWAEPIASSGGACAGGALYAPPTP